MNKTPRIVIDASVLFSACITENGPPRELYRQATEGRISLIVSDYTLEEVKYNLVIKNYELGLYWLNVSLENLIFEYVPNPSRSSVLRNLDLVPGDEKDVPYMLMAIEHRADYIVSGDKDLLEIGDYVHEEGFTIRIVNPREMLEIVTENN